ncbi:glycosyltransferase family 4 protein [Thauera sinica]|uniref:Glycosyltransferase family 4 protein n=1 Tax=Thauera sinica TaxID=2665146 RepID=A0ABW1ANN3_9RHOO|nr:glycosyltransferase family 4 protein [Thauera sp. K11]ATE60533.1 hypothetical protein CCZ27_11770 [Thauera sp. K11]
MHVAIAGPIAVADLKSMLGSRIDGLPAGYDGAPFMGSLVQELIERGHTVTGITLDASLPLRTDGVVRYSQGPLSLSICPCRPRAWMPNGRRPGRIVDFFAYERRLIEAELRRVMPDIVHAHWAYEFALAGLAADLPMLVTLHDDPGVVLKHTRSPYRAFRLLMAHRAMRKARHITAPSDYLATALGTHCGSPIAIVPNPLAAYVMDRAKVKPAPQSRRLAMICNGWARLKNPELGIAGFQRFRATAPEAELHLYGHGFGPGGEANQWAQSHGLADGCVFHGPTPHRELMDQLASMDVLLHPSREESFGVVVAEAMCLGLNVVAGRSSGAVPWVLSCAEEGGSTPGQASSAGILVDVESSESIANGIASVFSDGRYAARSKAGMQKALRRFSPKAVADAYQVRYESVLRETRGGRR